MDISVEIDKSYLDEEIVKELTEDLTKQAEAEARFRPYRVRVDSEHATMIEFGTKGSPIPPRENRSTGRKKSQESWSEAAKNIKKWVDTRSNNTATDEESFLIFKKIMREGIPPQPFVRPALHLVEMLLETTDTFRNASVRDIAELFKMFMLEYLRRNRTIYEGGSIADKIYVEEAVDQDDRFDEFLNTLPQEIWDSDYMDLEGDETRAKARQNNLDKLRFKI